MSTTTTAITSGPGLYRLSPRMRKAVLTAHIAAAGAWLGIDMTLGVLVVVAITADALPAAAASASLAVFATWPLIIAGALTLASGIVLGLGSKYRLARYWWVLVKLVLNVVLLALVIAVLRPMIGSVSDDGLTALATGTPSDAPLSLLFPPIVSSAAVVVAITLSIFKPWGRVGRRQPASPSRTTA